jgi:adenosine deaminase
VALDIIEVARRGRRRHQVHVVLLRPGTDLGRPVDVAEVFGAANGLQAPMIAPTPDHSCQAHGGPIDCRQPRRTSAGVSSQAMPRDLRTLPKAHLHLHLEAAQRPSTLGELLQRYGIPAPPAGDGTFDGFLRIADVVFRSFRRPDEYVRLVGEMAEDAGAQGAVWLEPGVWLTQGTADRIGLADPEAVLRALLEAAADAQAATGVGIGFMISASRNRPPEEAVALARLAARYAGRGVVSFGMGGDEARGPAEPFAPAFAIARAAGLLCTPHAGEHAGPPSVLAALNALSARRILHGVRAVEDPILVQRLVDSGVCLDVCPTSNVALSVCRSLHEHPLPKLLAAGVACSLNADDPVIFGCDLLDEYELARRALGLDDPALAEIARNSLRHSGAPDALKREALGRIDNWL